MAGRKCTVCNHKQNAEINQAIAQGESLRSIAERFGLKSNTNVLRHAQTCLSADLGAIQQAKREEARLTATQEFEKQLQYAKQIREAALKVLEDPDDPLKLTLDVWAHEIDVVYFDYNDMTGGENPRPKKKRAQLSTLLAMLMQPVTIERDDKGMHDAVWSEWEDKGEGWSWKRSFDFFWDKAKQYFMHTRHTLNLEAEKIHIKQTDLRKYAIDALNAADMAIDKLAKIEGVYKADQPNDAKAKALDAIATLLHMRPELKFKEAAEYILRHQRETNMLLVDPTVMRQVARENGVVLELEGLQ